MSACRHAEPWRRIVAAFALAALTAASAAAQDAGARVQELFDGHQFGAAFEACEAIPDPRLRAEWRFHVLYFAGDLGGALDAALAGLEQAPDDSGLGYNALRCALRLRNAAVAARVRAQLAATPAGAPGELANELDQLADCERSAVRCTRRAQTFALASLIAVVVGIVMFARRSEH